MARDVCRICAFVSPVLLAAWVGLAACGKSSDESAGTPIGPAGGSVSSPEGAGVTIPSGALATQTPIAVRRDSAGAPPLPIGSAAASEVFAFTPHGTAFALPVEIRVPFDPAKVPGGATPALLKTDATRTSFEAVSGARVDGATLRGNVSGFSFVVVTYYYPPTITRQPRDQGVFVGQTATFEVHLDPDDPVPNQTYLYQWQITFNRGDSWDDIPGAIAATYTTAPTTKAFDGAGFRLLIWWNNNVGKLGPLALSDPVKLIVNGDPQITEQPKSTSAHVGDPGVEFCVAAVGTAPLTYQWRLNGAAIAGANASCYALPPVGLGDNGHRFSCVVTNGSGATATSDEAILTVVEVAHPPGAAITAPHSGDTLTGVVTLEATATDDVGVTAVRFYDGLALIGPATEGTDGVWRRDWDTAVVPAGPHDLKARAVDTDGNEADSPPISVVVAAQAPAPTIKIMQPTGDLPLFGTATLVAEVAGFNVYSVDFLVDGATLVPAHPISAPGQWWADWDTTTVNPGTHTLQAIGTSVEGPIYRSTVVNVIVMETAIPDSIKVSFDVSGTAADRAGRCAAVGAATVVLTASGPGLPLKSPVLDCATAPPYVFTALAAGTYTVAGIAFDGAGAELLVPGSRPSRTVSLSAGQSAAVSLRFQVPKIASLQVIDGGGFHGPTAVVGSTDSSTQLQATVLGNWGAAASSARITIAGATVPTTVGGEAVNRSTSFNTALDLRAQSGPLAHAGTVAIGFLDPFGNPAQNQLDLALVNPPLPNAPLLSAFTLLSAAGAQDLQISTTGFVFATDATVQIGGGFLSLVPTVPPSPPTGNKLTVHLTAQQIFDLGDGTVNVTVTNPPPGGGTSPPATLDVRRPKLALQADPPNVPAGGQIFLQARLDDGVGPYAFAWRGYGDDGRTDAGAFDLADPTTDFPIATLHAPASDFYFFCTVTDQGAVPPTPAAQTGRVRVHATNGPIAIATVTTAPIRAGLDDVQVDASGSVNVVDPLSYSWRLEYGGSADPSAQGIEGYLQLGSAAFTLVQDWTASGATFAIPKALLQSAGAYRVAVKVAEGTAAHQAYEYFQVQP